jgi:hypothetical protein
MDIVATKIDVLNSGQAVLISFFLEKHVVPKLEPILFAKL